MYCVVGLGNPGGRYSRTRHNLGFQVVDRLAADYRTNIRRWEYLALTATVRIGRSEVLLMKPQTLMNRSGRSVACVCRALDLLAPDLIVVHDDVDLELGRLRIRRSGGSGGHRGIASIVEAMRSAEFVRVKLGVGRPAGTEDVADYVLSPFLPQEREDAEALVARGAEAVQEILSSGLEAAMQRVNPH